MKRIACVAALMLGAANAYAQPYLIVGAGKAEIDHFEPTTFYAGGGYEFSPYLSTELRIGAAGEDTIHTGAGWISAEIDYHASALARVSLPLGSLHPYVIGGITAAKLTVETASGKDSSSDTGAAYGGGLRYDWGQASVYAEWLRLIDTSDYEVDAITIGINFPL